jgi:toxin-antitoxin system PIN domain toxin
MFVVDTNVLLDAVNRGAREHPRCRELLERWRRDPLPWAVSWGILYEFIRVSTHPRVFPRPLSSKQAWSVVDSLLVSPSLQVLVPALRHREVARRTFAELADLRGHIVHDAAIAILMREHGVATIYSRDTDLHRFPFLDVVDPMTL